MALRKGKIVEAALVQRSRGAEEQGRKKKEEAYGQKQEAYGKKQEKFSSAPLLLCNPYAAYPSA